MQLKVISYLRSIYTPKFGGIVNEYGALVPVEEIDELTQFIVDTDNHSTKYVMKWAVFIPHYTLNCLVTIAYRSFWHLTPDTLSIFIEGGFDINEPAQFDYPYSEPQPLLFYAVDNNLKKLTKSCLICGASQTQIIHTVNGNNKNSVKVIDYFSLLCGIIDRCIVLIEHPEVCDDVRIKNIFKDPIDYFQTVLHIISKYSYTNTLQLYSVEYYSFKSNSAFNTILKPMLNKHNLELISCPYALD